MWWKSNFVPNHGRPSWQYMGICQGPLSQAYVYDSMGNVSMPCLSILGKMMTSIMEHMLDIYDFEHNDERHKMSPKKCRSMEKLFMLGWTRKNLSTAL